jgi:hypothetical protein
MEDICIMQVQSFHRDGGAIDAIARVVITAAATACFAWLFILVMASALRPPQRRMRIDLLRRPDDNIGRDMSEQLEGCDCPWCERELY